MNTVEELRLERLRQRLTQFDLWKKSGLKPYRVSLLENGIAEPKPQELKAWREALGVEEHNGNGKTAA